MNVTNAIRTVYLNHLVGVFGNDGLAMVHELPRFTAISSGRGVIVVAEGSKSRCEKLETAIELYVSQTGETVMFEGNLFEATRMELAA